MEDYKEVPRNTLHISHSSEIEVSVKGTEIASNKSPDEKTTVINTTEKRVEPPSALLHALDSADKKSMLDKLLENMTIGKESSLDGTIAKRDVSKSKSAMSMKRGSEGSQDSELRNPMVRKMHAGSRVQKIQALKNEILQRLEVRNLYRHSKSILKRENADLSLTIEG